MPAARLQNPSPAKASTTRGFTWLDPTSRRSRTVFRKLPCGSSSRGGRGAQLDDGETLDEEWIVLHADLQEAWPSSDLVVVEGTGHYIHNERPELVVEAIEGVSSRRSTSDPSTDGSYRIGP